MRNCDGQAFVETAIVLPFAFLLLFLLFEFSLVYVANNLLELATFRAARSYLSVYDKETADKAFALTMKPVNFSGNKKVLYYSEYGETDNEITVSIVYFYTPLFPIYRLADLLSINLNEASSKPLIQRGLTAISAEGESENRIISMCTVRKLNK
ncbi:MAG: pilus assembly protein [Fibrobacteres bacterium]|nr:pilus assembly protein [Fibrobacterota bacterium]